MSPLSTGDGLQLLSQGHVYLLPHLNRPVSNDSRELDGRQKVTSEEGCLEEPLWGALKFPKEVKGVPNYPQQNQANNELDRVDGA